MNKRLLVAGAIAGGTAVLIGAFGAHGLEDYLDEKAIKTFETGVRYQMYHALLLLGVPTFALSEKTNRILLILLLLGMVLFSGSIYLLATNAMTPFDFKKIGFVTPVGGSLLIAAWLVLTIHFFKIKVLKN